MEKIDNILAILVLYKTRLEESTTFQSLKKSLEELNLSLELLVYDNSPVASMEKPEFTIGGLHITYIHNSENPGLAVAYNAGLQIAIDRKKNWMLLLDQDTEIPNDYIDEITTLKQDEFEKVVCVIPKVISSKTMKIISPSKIFYGGICRPIKNLSSGIINKRITSVNSGTLLSVKFISQIGGFIDNFPLDMLDHWYFWEIYKANENIYLLKSSIFHSLSVDSFKDKVSISRYKMILKAEKLFFNNIFDRGIYKFRLVFRLLKQLFYKDKRYFYLSFKGLFGLL